MKFSYKGKILISTPDLLDRNFSRAVVLIIKHDEAEGAFGLVLNKKNELMSELLFRLFGSRADVYDGGPVDKGRLFFITKRADFLKHYEFLDGGFFITEDLESIVGAVIDGIIDISDFKVFSGYSGWSAQQLEEEVAAKYWTAANACNLDYIAYFDQNLWKNILQNLGGEHLLWANAPEDITMN